MIIDILGKFSGPQQFVVLQRLPAILNRIKGRIEDDAMRVQMRVEGAGGVMSESRRREIACETGRSAPPPIRTRVAAKASNSRNADLHRPRMGFKNSLVFTQESRDGNRFRRGKCEIVKYPPISRCSGAIRSASCSCRWVNCFASGRMLILTQPQKIFGADFAGQSQSFRAQPNPFAGHALTFIVIITDAKVFLEVFLRVLQVVLRLGRDHASDITRTVRACGVADTPPRERLW